MTSVAESLASSCAQAAKHLTALGASTYRVLYSVGLLFVSVLGRIIEANLAKSR